MKAWASRSRSSSSTRWRGGRTSVCRRSVLPAWAPPIWTSAAYGCPNRRSGAAGPPRTASWWFSGRRRAFGIGRLAVAPLSLVPAADIATMPAALGLGGAVAWWFVRMRSLGADRAHVRSWANDALASMKSQIEQIVHARLVESETALASDAMASSMRNAVAIDSGTGSSRRGDPPSGTGDRSPAGTARQRPGGPPRSRTGLISGCGGIPGGIPQLHRFVPD